MGANQNRAQKLYFSRYGGEQPIPAEFLAAMDRTEEVTPGVPESVGPEALSGTVVESKVETNRTNERELRTVKKKAGSIVLLGVNTNDQGQPVQVTRTLHPTGDTPPIPSATSSVADHDLGNGWSILEVGVEGYYDGGGTFQASVFSDEEFSVEIQDPVPERFRTAEPLTETSETVAGTAELPTLGANDLKKVERQITLYKKVLTQLTRAGLSLPIVLVGKKTDANGQVVTVTETYRVAGTAPVPTATKDVEVVDLGEGHEVVTTQVVPTVFAKASYDKVKADVVPEDFRATLPVRTTESVVTGSASMPSLASDELRASQQQITEFVKLVRSVARNELELPISLTSYDQDQDGQVVTVVRTLKDVEAPTTPTATTKVQTQNLGDGTMVEIVRTVPEVFSRETFTKERPDATPEEFRVLVPAVSTEEIVAGTALMPDLGAGDLSASEQQLDEFRKLTKVLSRAGVELPVSLVGYDTNDKGQAVMITRTLMAEGSYEAPSELQDVVVQPLGDGNVVQTVRAIDTVFDRTRYETKRDEALPPEFRVAIPATEEQHIVVGTASAPSLSAGDLEATEEQVTEFVKLTRLLTRAGVSLPISLVGKDTNDKGQVVTVTRTVRVAGSDPTPTALKDVVVQPLGDGNVLETKREIAAIFTGDTFTSERPDPVPEEFRVLVPAESTETIVAGSALMPTLGSGDLSATEKQLTEFLKLTRVLTRAGVELPVSLVGKDTNEKDQVVTITRTLRAAGSDPAPTALKDVVVQALGDGNVVETKREVSAVFAETEYTVSTPDPVPPEFRILAPTTETTIVSAGTASSPSLSTGDLSKTEKQVTTFIKLARTLTRAGVELPISLTSYDETQEGQVETVVRTLKTLGSPTTPTALIKVRTQNLGDGTMVEETRTIASVFVAGRYQTVIPDNVPQEFRSAVPTTTTEVRSAGTADTTPDLSTGDLSKSEEQIDAFVKRVTTTSRGSISFPVSLTSHETTEEYGGGDLGVVATIDSTIMTIDSGLLVVSSEVKDLGSSLWLKVTKTLNTSAWPTLVGTKVDENLRLAIPYTKKVVVAGTEGGVAGSVVTEAQPIDKWRTITIASTIPDDLSSLNITYPTTRNYILPDTIVSAEFVSVWAAADVSGDSLDASYSYDAAVKYQLKSGYRGAFDGRIIETYTTTPDTTSSPVTKFFPEEWNATTTFWWAFAGTSARTQARVFQFRLPSSLHDTIDLTPSTPSDGTVDGMIVPATTPVALPASGTLITIDRMAERWRFGIWRNQIIQVYIP